MFETALIEDGPKRGALRFSGSLLLQCGVAAGFVCVSLTAPVALPEVPFLNIAVPVPRFQDAVKLISTTVASALREVRPTRKLIYRPATSQPVARQDSAASMDALARDVPVLQGISFPDGVVGSVQFSSVAPPPPPKPVIKEEPKPQAVFRRLIGGEVLAAKILHRLQPVYPPLARQMRIQGVVQLHSVITKEGRIGQLRVISGHPLLVKAALEAVQQWVYSPTYLNQQPIEVEAPIEVRFMLSQ